MMLQRYIVREEGSAVAPSRHDLDDAGRRRLR